MCNTMDKEIVLLVLLGLIVASSTPLRAWKSLKPTLVFTLISLIYTPTRQPLQFSKTCFPSPMIACLQMFVRFYTLNSTGGHFPFNESHTLSYLPGILLCTCIKRNYRTRNVNPTFCETDLDCHAGKGKCIELLGRCFESQFDYNRGGEVGVNHFPTQSIHI